MVVLEVVEVMDNEMMTLNFWDFELILLWTIQGGVKFMVSLLMCGGNVDQIEANGSKFGNYSSN